MLRKRQHRLLSNPIYGFCPTAFRPLLVNERKPAPTFFENKSAAPVCRAALSERRRASVYPNYADELLSAVSVNYCSGTVFAN